MMLWLLNYYSKEELHFIINVLSVQLVNEGFVINI
jgi:hypothetical protein